jgi:hypothetical protein
MCWSSLFTPFLFPLSRQWTQFLFCFSYLKSKSHFYGYFKFHEFLHLKPSNRPQKRSIIVRGKLYGSHPTMYSHNYLSFWNGRLLFWSFARCASRLAPENNESKCWDCVNWHKMLLKTRTHSDVHTDQEYKNRCTDEEFNSTKNWTTVNL